MPDVYQEVDAFAERLMIRMDRLRDLFSDGKGSKEELRDLFGYEYIDVLVLRHRKTVDNALRFLWGNYGRLQVKMILNNPDVSHHQLLVLTDLLHDNVPYEADIDQVMESVSYALGNDNLFGRDFAFVELRRAVAQVQ